VINTTEHGAIKQKYSVPEKLEGCHTAVVGGYVVEGLGPGAVRPEDAQGASPDQGVSLPGMPVGAPGIAGRKAGPSNRLYAGLKFAAKGFCEFLMAAAASWLRR